MTTKDPMSEVLDAIFSPKTVYCKECKIEVPVFASVRGMCFDCADTILYDTTEDGES